ncbi:MAG: GNAT family N-acetyltransferase [Pseudomonadota bacterium]
MPDGSDLVEISLADSVGSLPAGDWDAVADAADGNPFTSHRFLSALEISNSVGDDTGWLPRPLVMRRDGVIVGAAPLYAKFHSQGEYVFDQHWADAYHRAGGRYYPKLVIAAPFTPVTGARFLAGDVSARAALAAGAVDVAGQMGVSSLHVNFVDTADHAIAGDEYLMREGVQYHWFNEDYQSFDDFLSALTSRKRKVIKRERRQAVESGIVIRRLRGPDITPRHWDAFWNFYQDTGARKWGTPYLTRGFFEEIASTMQNETLFIVAERDSVPIAGALNFIGKDAIYGRYWGCSEHHAFLHFEICYHQAIEFAIEHGLARVEAGAQGEHKIARGYRPVATHSLHWLKEPSFRDAIANYLKNERAQNNADINYLADFQPFKKGDA